MRPIDPLPPDAGFLWRRVVYAAGQREYEPLPALVDRAGVVRTRWELSDDERAAIAAGECIRLELLTFGQPLQPIRIAVEDTRGQSGTVPVSQGVTNKVHRDPDPKPPEDDQQDGGEQPADGGDNTAEEGAD